MNSSIEHKFLHGDPAQRVHFQCTFVAKPGTAETAEHFDCSTWDFQVDKRYSDLSLCIGCGVLPKSSILEQHMQFLDPGGGGSLAAAGAQFRYQVLLSFSVKGSEGGT